MSDGPGDNDEAHGLASFAERLLAVIDEGRRTATYKLAVLLALMDCCAEGASPAGLAPTAMPTRVIARHVARLYWPQLRPFPTEAGPVALRQITNRSSTILHSLRTAFDALPYVPAWETAESTLPADHVDQVLDVVEFTRGPLSTGPPANRRWSLAAVHL